MIFFLSKKFASVPIFVHERRMPYCSTKNMVGRKCAAVKISAEEGEKAKTCNNDFVIKRF